ncbi:uncharacterized protein LOC115927729 [Strongylocentrotus purpuratus]|uniref:Uncharacterized protein n=1 Tax=Strongylocentrotus purpuratus TaxID=7668 RepID=A0A7M7PF89_STRPU|nr:uncharacterized protein LOC115927729 [Strongylocentrotus purpuratus]
MRGLGLLIGEETKNLYWLILTRVKCTDEEDLVELVECCRNVKTMNHLMLLGCGTNADGRLSRHITGLHNPKKSLGVIALHQLTHIDLTAPDSLPSEKQSVSRETMRGLGLLIREQTKNLQWLCLSRVKGTNEEDLVELVECCKHVKTINHLMLLGCGTNADGRLSRHITGLHNPKKSLGVIALHDDGQLRVEKCQLSTEMTKKLWSCLRSFTSLNRLTISDSSLSFPSSPPDLPPVTKLSADSVTSQSYEGLLSSLPGLTYIDITIDDAERDIPQITAGLRRTRGQQLTHIDLTAPYTLPSEKNRVSRETMRGFGLLIREQTNNLQRLDLRRVKCTDEKDLVYLIECCRHVKTMTELW